MSDLKDKIDTLKTERAAEAQKARQLISDSKKQELAEKKNREAQGRRDLEEAKNYYRNALSPVYDEAKKVGWELKTVSLLGALSGVFVRNAKMSIGKDGLGGEVIFNFRSGDEGFVVTPPSRWDDVGEKNPYEVKHMVWESIETDHIMGSTSRRRSYDQVDCYNNVQSVLDRVRLEAVSAGAGQSWRTTGVGGGF